MHSHLSNLVPIAPRPLSSPSSARKFNLPLYRVPALIPTSRASLAKQREGTVTGKQQA